jgi:transposase
LFKFASRRLKAPREEIFDALQGELTESHRFVLRELMGHLEELEARIARFDEYLLAGLKGERTSLVLLQTIPGIDLIGAALLLVEIGSDMSVSATWNASLPGAVCVPAITNPPENENPDTWI